jgi:ubiquinone/menaquinone biosynthesis C-methylase UbiE
VTWQRVESFGRELDELMTFRGDERALDVGTGTGPLALALAARVREVVGIDTDTERIEQARAGAPANVELIVGDAEALPFDAFSFDVVATSGMIHHTRRPELVVAELVRVTRPGGTVLVSDRVAPTDPLAALELNLVERSREPSITRILSDGDLRGLFDANNLVLRRQRLSREEGGDGASTIAWYVLTRP